MIAMRRASPRFTAQRTREERSIVEGGVVREGRGEGGAW
jgi:hypothetical protein